MTIGFHGLHKNDFQFYRLALCSCVPRHHHHSVISWLTGLIEFPVTFRWREKLVAKHKTVTTVSADCSCGSKWQKIGPNALI